MFIPWLLIIVIAIFWMGDSASKSRKIRYLDDEISGLKEEIEELEEKK